MSVVAQNILVGKRAVYTRINRKWDEVKREYIETGRELFRGTIAALITIGQYHYAAVVMLYDDGSLRTHDIDTITIEASPAGYRDPPGAP